MKSAGKTRQAPPPPGRPLGALGSRHRKRDTRICLAALTILYLAGVHALWWPTPDSALYRGLGRSIAQGEGYVFNGRPNDIASPGWPCALAGAQVLFEQEDLLVNLLHAAVGMACVVLIWRAVTRLSNSATGLLVAIMTALSYRFFQSGHEVLTDMPFAAGFWATILLVLRFGRGHWAWLIAAAASALIACAIRVPGVVAIGALAVGVALAPEVSKSPLRRLAASAVLLAVAVGSWVGYLQLMDALAPGREAGYTQYAGQAVSGAWWQQLATGLYNLAEVLAEAITGQEFMPVGVAAVVLMLVSGALRFRTHRLAVTVALAYWLAMMLSTGAWTIRARYFVPVLGLYLYTILDGLVLAVWWIRSRRRRPWSRAAWIAAMVLVVLVSASNAPKVLRWSGYYTYLSWAGGYYEHIADGNHAYVPEMRRRLGDIIPPEGQAALTGSNSSILAYLSGRAIRSIDADQRATEADARQILSRWNQGRRPILIHDPLDGQDAYLEAMQQLLADEVRAGRLRPVYTAATLEVYRRVVSESDSDDSASS